MKLNKGTLVYSTLYKIGRVIEVRDTYLKVAWEYKGFGTNYYNLDGTVGSCKLKVLQFLDQNQINEMDKFYGVSNG